VFVGSRLRADVRRCGISPQEPVAEDRHLASDCRGRLCADTLCSVQEHRRRCLLTMNDYANIGEILLRARSPASRACAGWAFPRRSDIANGCPDPLQPRPHQNL